MDKKYYPRTLEVKIKQALKRQKSVMLWGARQTGKTTLLSQLGGDLYISLLLPEVRQHYEKNPTALKNEIEALAEDFSKPPLVLLDEIQKVPSLLDVVQYLIDHKVAQFVLTGSSARSLRRKKEINLLPGRVVSCHLDPVTFQESPTDSLESLLLYGSLPGILWMEGESDKEIDLDSYVTIYLEEEIRREAVVRNIGDFARFLELAASESGHIINYHKLSNEIGVSHSTIASYYQILEDCLIIERVQPFTKSQTRKKLTKSPKFLFFDLGVRRLAAREGAPLSREKMGQLFEQYVGLELIRNIRFSKDKISLSFWRDPNGPEVDWLLQKENKLIPIEVKWASHPSKRDAKHIETFMREYSQCETGYVVCQTKQKAKLTDSVMAIPWQEIHRLV